MTNLMSLTELEKIAKECLNDPRVKTFRYYYGLVLNQTRGRVTPELRKNVCTYYFYGKADKELRAFYFKEWANKVETKLFPHRNNSFSSVTP